MEKRKEEEREVPAIVEEVEEETISTVNKNLIFEIEQELAATWSAKQRAQITQDVVRFSLLSDKEIALKKELAMAERGEIQARLESKTPKTVAKPKETKVVSTSPKVIPKKKPVAVKVIKPKKEGPSAAEQFFAPLISAVSFVENKYMEYKKEGKLSLFFLTVAGIVTLFIWFWLLSSILCGNLFGKLPNSAKSWLWVCLLYGCYWYWNTLNQTKQEV